MIARIKGILIQKSIGQIIVETQGIGYRIFVPLTTFYELPDAGRAVSLHVHTHVKEDAIHLFGFHRPEDQTLFQMLISVAGIGPRLALNILSGIPAVELIRAVTQGNLGRLVAVPGVGKKTAERMLVELKDRILRMEWKGGGSGEIGRPDREAAVREDALSALLNLGYKKTAAQNVIDEIVSASSAEVNLDVLLKEALKRLSG